LIFSYYFHIASFSLISLSLTSAIAARLIISRNIYMSLPIFRFSSDFLIIYFHYCHADAFSFIFIILFIFIDIIIILFLHCLSFFFCHTIIDYLLFRYIFINIIIIDDISPLFHLLIILFSFFLFLIISILRFDFRHFLRILFDFHVAGFHFFSSDVYFDLRISSPFHYDYFLFWCLLSDFCHTLFFFFHATLIFFDDDAWHIRRWCWLIISFLSFAIDWFDYFLRHSSDLLIEISLILCHFQHFRLRDAIFDDYFIDYWYYFFRFLSLFSPSDALLIDAFSFASSILFIFARCHFADFATLFWCSYFHCRFRHDIAAVFMSYFLSLFILIFSFAAFAAFRLPLFLYFHALYFRLCCLLFLIFFALFSPCLFSFFFHFFSMLYFRRLFHYAFAAIFWCLLLFSFSIISLFAADTPLLRRLYFIFFFFDFHVAIIIIERCIFFIIILFIFLLIFFIFFSRWENISMSFLFYYYYYYLIFIIIINIYFCWLLPWWCRCRHDVLFIIFIFISFSFHFHYILFIDSHFMRMRNMLTLDYSLMLIFSMLISIAMPLRFIIYYYYYYYLLIILLLYFHYYLAFFFYFSFSFFFTLLLANIFWLLRYFWDADDFRYIIFYFPYI